MSRVALLPSRGDPVTYFLFFNSYKNIWQKEVDRLIVHINSPVDPSIVEFIKSYSLQHCNNVEFMYSNYYKNHGGALNEMFDLIKEDVVLFVEEDSAFIKSGVADKYFKLVENNNYACVGVPRFFATPNLIKAIANKYGSCAQNYWPCFFWARLKDLEQTDKNFGSYGFEVGRYIEQLHWVVDEEGCCCDTFGWMSIQLRGLGLKFLDLPYCPPTPIPSFNALSDHQNKAGFFHPNCEFIHHRSLSPDIVTDENNKCIFYLPRIVEVDLNVANQTKMLSLHYIEHLIAWSCLSLECFENDFKPIESFINKYKGGIDKLIQIWELDVDVIRQLVTIYKNFIK